MIKTLGEGQLWMVKRVHWHHKGEANLRPCLQIREMSLGDCASVISTDLSLSVQGEAILHS
uniref:Uncharacterized protein n=1 Tax=Anguilla anguilla TaxID=7936 RepID=A0A0E9SUF9_ANGAN